MAAKIAKEKEITACSAEIDLINKNKNKSDKASENLRIEITKIDHKLLSLEKNGKEAKERLDALNKLHSWIQKEKSFFGKKDSDFDFEAKSVKESKKRVQELIIIQVRALRPYLHF